jgi:hypothetical protein
MDLKRQEDVNGIHLTQDGPVVGPCKHDNEPLNAVKGR